MKKYFLSLVAMAAAMLFATSCQESLVEPQVGGPTTFTVQVPDQMGTKAIGDAENTNRLYVQVYPKDFSGDAPIYEGGATMDSDGMFRVSINLIQDQTYGIIFWAQNESSKYNVGNLRKIDLNIEHHNSELGAAFYHTMTFEAGESQEVVLRRPFAQLNLGTSAQSLDTDVSASNIKLLTSRVIVTGIASSFNTVEGKGVAPVTYTYITGDAAVNTDKLNVDGTDYHYISMDYLPVVDNESLVTVQAYVTTDAGDIEHSFTNVPVKKNYRTNIVGNLISSTTDFVVKVNEDWAGEDKTVEFREVSTADELIAAVNAGVEEIVLVADIELDQPLMFGAPASSSIARASATETPSFVLDLGGKTITTDLQSEGRHYYAIDNYANLTIVGEGAINARGIQNFGTMTIDGDITITNIDTNGGAAIWNEGNITINAGTFISGNPDIIVEGSYGAALNTRPSEEKETKAIVNGGTFIAYSQLTYAIINEGETIINNAIVKGRHGAVAGAESNDNTKIYGGSFELMENPAISDHCTYYVSSISGGQFTLGKNTDSGAQVFYESNIAEGYQIVSKDGVMSVVKSPKANFAENTWEDIILACQNNVVPESWKVGDIKTMKIGDYTYEIAIIGKNHDTYTGGTTKAPLTFQLFQLYGTDAQMNETQDNTTGWSGSKMRNTTMGEILSAMPDEVKNAIKAVDKVSLNGSKDALETTSDKLFLLSEKEVNGSEHYSGGYVEGTRYAYYADQKIDSKGNIISQIMKQSPNKDNKWTVSWFLRTPKNRPTEEGYQTRFIIINGSGYMAANTAEIKSGVVFGFCF